MNEREMKLVRYLLRHPGVTAKELVAAGILDAGSAYVHLGRARDRGFLGSSEHGRPKYYATVYGQQLLALEEAKPALTKLVVGIAGGVA